MYILSPYYSIFFHVAGIERLSKKRVNSSVPHQWPLTSSLSKRPILGPRLSNNFINYLDDGAECTSARLQRACEEQLMCQRTRLSFIGTSRDCRNGVKAVGAREASSAEGKPRPLAPCRYLPAPLCHWYPLPCSSWHSANLSQPILLQSRTHFVISTNSITAKYEKKQVILSLSVRAAQFTSRNSSSGFFRFYHATNNK